jgi:hypothetical protein
MRITIPRLAAAMLLPAFIAHAAAADAPTLQEKMAAAATMRAPAGALMAFQMIDNCVRLRRGEPMSTYDEAGKKLRPMTDGELRRSAAECAGLTDELAEARMDYLDRALKSHADGAAAAFLLAGPGGDPAMLRERPNDPQVIAWKKQAVDYLAEAALRGDYTGLIHLQIQQVHPEQLGAPLALIYAADATLLRITLQVTGQEAPGDVFSVAARHLTPEQLLSARSLSDSMLAAYNGAHPAAAAN